MEMTGKKSRELSRFAPVLASSLTTTPRKGYNILVLRHVVLDFVITSTLFTGLRCDFSVLSLVDKYYIVLPECNPDF